ncbi:hypothetical protein [Streptomyces hainanensis]|uniref:Uncharacterized protein n=1 Tax=Streptomyces hainanensis TaxID=402648 RepID=A0A4R4SX42_9ACTN|nr:hypothetical protein [Streptomyces hainanensis]TDC68858.1 hypothetical protein E1283_26785 [Streptomyces hainanensis]
MTSDATHTPRAVYRPLPALRDIRTLSLDHSLVRLKRWQITGKPTERPTGFGAAWGGDPDWPTAGFPSGYPGAPILTPPLVAALGADRLAAAGELLPVRVEGAEPGAYQLLLVEPVVDCLDARHSSKPKRVTGHVKQAVFRPDAVPAELPAFRIPQYPTAVYWNGWAVERLGEVVGAGLEARLVWSEDPALVPHRDPMWL